MTAIKQLREWFNRDKRPEVSAWITGDTVETRAILELADRLEKLEKEYGALSGLHAYKSDPNLPPITPLPMPAATESPPEPFRITGPGKYRMRNGLEAEVLWNDGSSKDSWPWQGTVGDEPESWNSDGTCLSPYEPMGRDIIADPLSDEPQSEPEMARLHGIMRFTAGQEPRPLSPIDMVDRVEVDIDLSKVPASAIVRPEPKREARKVWLVFWNCGEMRVYDRKPHFQFLTAPIAIVQREIDYVAGEGLEPGQ